MPEQHIVKIEDSKKEIVERILEKYIDAAGDAASRSRKVVFVMAVASVFCLIAWWNSGQSNWVEGRYRIINGAIKKYYPEYYKKLPLDQTTYPILNEQYPEKFKKNNQNYDAEIDSFISTRQLFTLPELLDYKDNIAIARKERLVVRIPIIGISFDVNDIGIIGGFSLVILLLVYMFCLDREVENIALVFAELSKSRDIELNKMYYNLLVSKQVLTNPPHLEKKKFQFDDILPKFLFGMPLVTQCLIVTNDFYTRELGSSINPVTTEKVLYISGMLFVLNLIISSACYLKDRQMNDEWKNHAVYIRDLLKCIDCEKKNNKEKIIE